MAERKLDVVIRAKDLFSKVLTRAQRRTMAFGKAVKVAAKMAAIALAALTVVMAAATIASIALNRAMANIASLIPKQRGRINDLKDAFQQLSMALGVSAIELAEAGYQVVSAFGDAADTMAKVELAAKAAKAGLSTTTEAVKLLSAVTKGYGDTSLKTTRKVSDLAFQTVKLGQTTFPDLAASIGMVVPLAAKMGVEVEELFAGFATLTGVTGDAAKVSTQLAAIMRAGIKPTVDMDAAVEKVNKQYEQYDLVSVSAIFRTFGMVEGMKKLVETTDGSEKAIGKLFGRVEGLTALFALTGGQADTFTRKLEAMRTASGATNEAFIEQTEGINKFEFELDKFKATFIVILQKIGDFITQSPAMIKAISSITSVMKDLARVFGIETRSALEIVNSQIDRWERAQLAGIVNLKDLSVAAGIYNELLKERNRLENENLETAKAMHIIDIAVPVKTPETSFAAAQGPGVLGADDLGEQALTDAIGPTAFGMQTRLEEMRIFHDAKIQMLIDSGAKAGAIQAQAEQATTSMVEQQEQLKVQYKRQALGMVVGLLGSLSTISDGHNKKMFKRQKKLAIAQALIGTYTGAAKALADVPYPWNILAMITVIAAGVAQVKNIQKQKYTGGSIGSSGGGSAPSFGASAPSIPQQLTQPVQQAQQITLIIHNPLSTDNWAEIAENNIIPAINDAAKRNIDITVQTVAA